jgi:2-iminoacetate synthase
MYKKYHTKGKKSNFDFRLILQTALVKAEFKIGLGVIRLGLAQTVFFNALHLDYLQNLLAGNPFLS